MTPRWLLPGLAAALAVTGCNPSARTETTTEPPAASESTVTQGPTDSTAARQADGETVTLDELGITFTMPAGLVEDGAVVDGGSWSASRLGPDTVGLVVFPCPGCTRADMDDGTSTVTETTIDGYPAIRSDSPSVGTYGLLIFADDREIGVTMITSNPETDWRQLVDSIEIAPA